MVCDLRIHQNVFGMNEPFLFPVKRTGQPVIHLARLVKEFFGLQKGFGFLDEPELFKNFLNRHSVRFQVT